MVGNLASVLDVNGVSSEPMSVATLSMSPHEELDRPKIPRMSGLNRMISRGSCDKVSSCVRGLHRVKAQLAMLVLIAVAWVGLWYFYCAYDLSMALYLQKQRPRSDRFEKLATSMFLYTSKEYSVDNEMKLALKQAFQDQEARAVATGKIDGVRAAKDLGELGKYLKAGKGTKVILTCISRDDYYGLSVNRFQLEELGRAFKDYRIIITENDSSNAYRKTLEDWARSNSKVKIISKTFNLKKRPHLGFLGRMRNYYIDEIRKEEYADFERVIIFDMDVSHRWPIESIVSSSVVRSDRFGVRCFHIYEQGYVHRDVLAFRSKKYLPEFHFSSYPQSVAPETLQQVHKISREWYKMQYSPDVDSCFGGMAVYSRSALMECKHDPERQDCEHLGLNECLKEKEYSVILDTTVAIPFHYRKIRDGLLVVLLFTSALPEMLVANLIGMLRCFWVQFYQRSLRVQSLRDIVKLFISGLVCQFWFVLLVKDRYFVGLLPGYAIACLLEFLTVEFTYRLMRTTKSELIGEK